MHVRNLDANLQSFVFQPIWCVMALIIVPMVPMNHHIHFAQVSYSYICIIFQTPLNFIYSFIFRCGIKNNFWSGNDMAGAVGSERIFGIECMFCWHRHLVMSSAHLKSGH